MKGAAQITGKAKRGCTRVVENGELKLVLFTESVIRDILLIHLVKTFSRAKKFEKSNGLFVTVQD